MPSKRRGKGRHRGHGAQEVHDLLKGLDNVRFIPYMRPLAAAVGWQLPAHCCCERAHVGNEAHVVQALEQVMDFLCPMATVPALASALGRHLSCCDSGTGLKGTRRAVVTQTVAHHRAQHMVGLKEPVTSTQLWQASALGGESAGVASAHRLERAFTCHISRSSTTPRRLPRNLWGSQLCLGRLLASSGRCRAPVQFGRPVAINRESLDATKFFETSGQPALQSALHKGGNCRRISSVMNGVQDRTASVAFACCVLARSKCSSRSRSLACLQNCTAYDSEHYFWGVRR